MKYLATSLYKAGTVVTHNGEIWEAVQPSMGAIPATNSKYWKPHTLSRPQAILQADLEDTPEYVAGRIYKQGVMRKSEGLIFRALKDTSNDPRLRNGCWEHVPIESKKFIPKTVVKEAPKEPEKEIIVVEKIVEKIIKEPLKFDLSNFWVET